MTGFGSASAEFDGASLTVEMKSVNGRGFSFSFKAPSSLAPHEEAVRARVTKSAGRGRVTMNVSVEDARAAGQVTLDVERIRAVLDEWEKVSGEIEYGNRPAPGDLLRIPGALKTAEKPPLEPPPPDVLMDAVERALAGLIEMRDREGRALAADLRGRVAALTEALDEAERLAPKRLERERERIRAAVEELAGSGLDDDRLARELAILADRRDVAEEIVRGRAHLEGFLAYLELPAGEPVGKRLAFLVQEMHREFNTLGAKANDPELSAVVIEARNEVEKLREQVENVE